MVILLYLLSFCSIKALESCFAGQEGSGRHALQLQPASAKHVFQFLFLFCQNIKTFFWSSLRNFFCHSDNNNNTSNNNGSCSNNDNINTRNRKTFAKKAAIFFSAKQLSKKWQQGRKLGGTKFAFFAVFVFFVERFVPRKNLFVFCRRWSLYLSLLKANFYSFTG